MAIDAARYPLLAAYARSLPQGLASYPQCQNKALLAHQIFEQFPALHEEVRNIPELAPTLAAGNLDPEAWFPDVQGNAARLLLRDRCFTDDAAFLKWNYDAALETYRRPVYRVLMFVLSPSLMLMGAQKRWGAFRTGSTLEGYRQKDRSGVVLKYPTNLYTMILLRGFSEAFRAALESAGGKNVRVEVESSSEESAQFFVAWD